MSLLVARLDQHLPKHMPHRSTEARPGHLHMRSLPDRMHVPPCPHAELKHGSPAANRQVHVRHTYDITYSQI